LGLPSLVGNQADPAVLSNLINLEGKVSEIKRERERRLGEDDKAYNRAEFTKVVPQRGSGHLNCCVFCDLNFRLI
jgi:hypothetical protein